MSHPAAELFQAVIDEHRRRPRHRGPLPAAHRVARRDNPACGDFCTLQLCLDPAPADKSTPLASATRIVAAAFTGAGCALSQASASLATVALTGRDVASALALIDELERLVRESPTSSPPTASPAPAAPGAAERLGELAALAAVQAFPARHACALLAWQAARDALARPDAP